MLRNQMMAPVRASHEIGSGVGGFVVGPEVQPKVRPVEDETQPGAGLPLRVATGVGGHRGANKLAAACPKFDDHLLEGAGYRNVLDYVSPRVGLQVGRAQVLGFAGRLPIPAK